MEVLWVLMFLLLSIWMLTESHILVVESLYNKYYTCISVPYKVYARILYGYISENQEYFLKKQNNF